MRRGRGHVRRGPIAVSNHSGRPLCERLDQAREAMEAWAGDERAGATGGRGLS